MADNVLITPGAGATIASDDVGGVQYQKIKLDMGGDGLTVPLVGDATFGLPVDIKRFPATAVLVNNPTAANLKVDASGVAVPITDNAGSLTIDAPVGTPVFVRLSDGTNPITGLAVSGTVVANQGATPAALANAWPIKLSDGADFVGITTVGGAKALKVDVIQSVALASAALADGTAFVEGTTKVDVVGGQFIAVPTVNPADGQLGAARITQQRAFHINLRTNAGAETGIVALPLRIDPTGTTAQPVTQSVADWTMNLTKVAGVALSAAAPFVTVHKGQSEARVTKSVAITASQTGSAVWTPAGGKKFYIRKLVIALSVGGDLELFDNTSTAANRASNGTMPAGYFPVNFEEPWASAAADNVLKYTTGASITGTITAHGFEV